ncbi:MAG: hypothetical protein AB7K04_12495 [Pseudorhodoplanes sp.]
MRVRFFAAAALTLALLHPALAQTADDNMRVVLENEQVRVVEMRFKPGAKLDMSSRPNRLLYGLTDGALLFSPPGKTPYELSFKGGEALWLPDQAVAQNEGDKEVRAVVVEFRNARPSGSRRAGSKRGGSKGSKPAAIKHPAAKPTR